MKKKKEIDVKGWHRTTFSCRECSYSCDISQDMEFEGEHEGWEFYCLSHEVKKPIWVVTKYSEVVFK